MILNYKYTSDSEDQWNFDTIELQKINLIVGASGSGKTRLLNTLFNVATFVSQGKKFRTGLWDITFLIKDIEYEWKFHGYTDNNGQSICEEKVYKKRRSNSILDDNSRELLIDRVADSFIYKGNELPKLDPSISSINLLKNESEIKPLYESFTKILRRNFHDEGFRDVSELQRVSPEMVSSVKNSRNISTLWEQQNTVSTQLYFLKNYFPDAFRVVENSFKNIFDSVESIEVVLLGENEKYIREMAQDILPGAFIKEKGIEGMIGINQLSSGMQKVLLLITDILTLPDDAIYIIDEYENSLGVNAIDFLPDFLIEHAGSTQFLVTTHHPYLINTMPINHWILFSRIGSNVTITDGTELADKYGKSSQKAFMQLINDPLYTG